MAIVADRRLTAAELATALRSVDPRVVLVPPRILRRVIKGALGLGGLARQVPHRGGFATTAATALAHAEATELGFLPGEQPPSYLILLAEPDPDETAATPRDVAFVRAWRDLFHARVHLAFDERPERFPAGGGWVADRVARIGPIAFAEARAVLVEDRFLALPADDRATYVEFAAAYLELSAFRPDLLRHTFPAIRDHAAIRDLVAADADPDPLLEATRPPGAPARPPSASAVEASLEACGPEEAPSTAPDPRRWARLKARAARASARGNNVRAAILRAVAARSAPTAERARTLAGARGELDTLARRLRDAVGLDADEVRRWRRALPALLDHASRGLMPREARFLSEVQKACSDRERPIYTIDVLGWVASRGRRPLRRPLPDQREVLILKRLRAAGKRLLGVAGIGEARATLLELVGLAADRQAATIRGRFRDRVIEILEGAGLRPANPPERAARRKLVEELMDLVVDRGFLRIGDLRDAVSRNGIKLKDLSGAGEFLRGDPLLRADAGLARTLDGVYHRGEVYLRALQRATSLAFGTKLGRWASLILALPFGAAFLGLEGLQHLVGPIVHAFGGVEPRLMNPPSYAAVAALLLGVINVPAFRAAFFRACRRIGRALRAAFYEAPAWVLDRPWIRSVASSRSFLLGWNWVAKPAAIVWLVFRLFPDPDASRGVATLARATAFALAAGLINSRPGRNFEEIAADGASRLGQRVWRDLVPNVFRGVMDVFAAALEAVERLLYKVDEWLRFRSGEGGLILASKAAIGLVWFFVTYLARIYVNLLIEPQVNPIKHFPVVTVSHKLMIPLIPTLFHILRTPLLPLGGKVANTIAGTTVFLLPGLFGFLVWELKENWRLYEANRPKALRPLPIGHHGETMSRLLRRGFHSGTVPKLFAGLRRAGRRAELGKVGAGAALKKVEEIEHVEQAVRHFVERGVISLLGESRSLGAARPTVAGVESATNRIVVEVRDGGDPATAARLAFEESNRRLHVRLLEPGWIAGLGDEPRRAVTTAIAGLCALSAVDLVALPGSSHEDPMPIIPWSAWVRIWSDDAAGLGHDPRIADACPILGWDPELRVWERGYSPGPGVV